MDKPWSQYFPFRPMQRADEPFETRPGTYAGILILRVMKAERISRLLDDLVWDETLISQVPPRVFEMLLRYILAADIDKTALETKIESLQNPATRQKAVSVAQQLRQEGRQEGSALLALRQIQRKFPSLAEQAARLVQRLSEEQLLAFGEALLFMESDGECLQWLNEAMA